MRDQTNSLSQFLKHFTPSCGERSDRYNCTRLWRLNDEFVADWNVTMIALDRAGLQLMTFRERRAD